jgi:hypothetical protein
VQRPSLETIANQRNAHPIELIEYRGRRLESQQADPCERKGVKHEHRTDTRVATDSDRRVIVAIELKADTNSWTESQSFDV